MTEDAGGIAAPDKVMKYVLVNGHVLEPRQAVVLEEAEEEYGLCRSVVQYEERVK